jgi:hypothetical protein
MYVYVDDAGDWFFPLAVANGMTNLRDTGSSISQVKLWRERRQREGEIMPCVRAAGPIVTCMVDDPDPRLVRVATYDDAERAVDSLVKQGVDFIKVHGWLSRDAYAGILARAIGAWHPDGRPPPRGYGGGGGLQGRAAEHRTLGQCLGRVSHRLSDIMRRLVSLL